LLQGVAHSFCDRAGGPFREANVTGFTVDFDFDGAARYHCLYFGERDVEEFFNSRCVQFEITGGDFF